MIDVKDLTKVYNGHKYEYGIKGTVKGLFHRKKVDIRAVDGISFHVDEGEFVGYIGPNGAGKSTTIKMLCGILTPTAGEVKVNGIKPSENRKSNAMTIGAVFGQRSQLWWDLPIHETYALFQHMYKIDSREYARKIDMVRELLGLSDFWNTPVRQLSLGQRMRGELGGSLLHDPKVLFLDEPTIGMDALVKDQIKTFLKRINQERRVTILLTTHDLKDVEDLCSRTLLINKGKLLYDGTLAEMRDKSSAKTKITVEFDREPQMEAMRGAIVGRPGIEAPDIVGRRATFLFSRKVYSPVQIIQLLSRDYEVNDVRITEPPIEEVIVDYYS